MEKSKPYEPLVRNMLRTKETNFPAHPIHSRILMRKRCSVHEVEAWLISAAEIGGIIFDFGIFGNSIQHYGINSTSPPVNKTTYTAQYATFRSLLKKMRKEKRLTQVELAKRLRMTQATVSKIEMAEQRLDVIQLRAWCEALEVPFPSFIVRLEALLGARKKT